MDGIFINGNRPKSKKEVKEAVAQVVALANPEPMTVGAIMAQKKPNVRIECTSMFGGYDGLVEDAPDGDYYFVGPDPYTSRKFYGTIKKSGDSIKVS